MEVAMGGIWQLTSVPRVLLDFFEGKIRQGAEINSEGKVNRGAEMLGFHSSNPLDSQKKGLAEGEERGISKKLI